MPGASRLQSLRRQIATLESAGRPAHGVSPFGDERIDACLPGGGPDGALDLSSRFPDGAGQRKKRRQHVNRPNPHANELVRITQHRRVPRDLGARANESRIAVVARE